MDWSVGDDWEAAGLFGCFVDIPAKSDPSKLFIHYDLGGQDCIMGCVSLWQLAKKSAVVDRQATERLRCRRRAEGVTRRRLKRVAMKSSESYPILLESLQEVRGQWRRNKILEGALLTLAGVAVVTAVLVAVDNWFQPDAVGRVLLAVVLWGGLIAALLGLVVRRFLEDRRDDFFAALVERQHPELHNQLINALQLGRGNQHGFSPGLIQAIVHDAGKATADMDMSDSIDRRPAKRAAGLALIGLLVVGGYAVAFPPEFGTGLARVLLPISDIAPYTRTHIKSVDPGKAVTRVPEGQSLPVEVRVDGVIPTSRHLIPPRRRRRLERRRHVCRGIGRRVSRYARSRDRVVRLLHRRRRCSFTDVPRRGGQAAARREPYADVHLSGLSRQTGGTHHRLRRRRGRHRGHDGCPGTEGNQAAHPRRIAASWRRTTRARKAGRRPHLGLLLRRLGADCSSGAGHYRTTPDCSDDVPPAHGRRRQHAERYGEPADHGVCRTCRRKWCCTTTARVPAPTPRRR